MSIVYISASEGGKECLRRIKDKVKVNYLVTINQDVATRASVSGYVSFRDTDIPTYYVNEYSMKNDKDIEMIRSLNPYLIIVNGWNRLVPKFILSLPKFGCLGFHGSWKKLPFGRGRSPINWAIINGERQFILHLFYLDEGVDSGNVIDTTTCDITPYDTCATVHGKVAMMAARLLIKNIPAILKGETKGTPQTGEPTYLPKRSPENGLIDWNKSTEEIYNFVRALTKPYPGAFTFLNFKGRKVKMHIWEAVPFDYRIDFEGEVGTIVDELLGKPIIQCKDGTLYVKDYTIEELTN